MEEHKQHGLELFVYGLIGSLFIAGVIALAWHAVDVFGKR